GFALGCMGMMLLQNIVRARWGKPVIRLLEAGARTLPLMGILLLLMLLWGAKTLYPWMNPGDDEILKYRQVWMNYWAVIIRSCIYFAIWSGLTFFITRYSRRQDETGDPSLAQVRTNVASIGGVIFCLTVNFAYTDWVMSLERYWYSTIYGLWWVLANSIAAITLVTAITALNKSYNDVVTVENRRDYGNLMLTHIMLWTYFALSQFLIIWAANKPDEVIFFLKRFNGGWLPIGWFIVLFQFFAPFLALLSGKTKKYATGVASVAIWLLILRPIDIAWTVLPSFAEASAKSTPSMQPWTIFLPCLGTFLAFGGVWFWLFIRQLKQAPLIPNHEARTTQEALHHA
ncbi:MAG TPA: hypothetical protein VKU00_34440, partial [Chthonomonadaceae bacterium]|nr:hypothetical protein [Chthonomonadaceae bacterium]